MMSSVLMGFGNRTEPRRDARRQLRKHPIQWREISTLEALRLLLRDILTQDDAASATVDEGQAPVWETLTIYHDTANAAARLQRGR